MVDMDAAHLLTEHLDSAGWPAAESVLARAMWEASSRLQPTRLECTGGVLERAASLQGMRTCLKELTLTMQNGRWGCKGANLLQLRSSQWRSSQAGMIALQGAQQGHYAPAAGQTMYGLDVLLDG
jgi:hypothetical protein